MTLALTDRLKELKRLLASKGINPLKLEYPIRLPDDVTVNSPTELIKVLLQTKNRQSIIKALTHQNHSPTPEEEDKPEPNPQLRHLYKRFKLMVSFFYSKLPDEIKKDIQQTKPNLKPYKVDDATIRVLLHYKGEVLPYELSLNHNEALLIRKAQLLVEDMRDITTGEFIPF